MSCKNLTCRGIPTPRALCDREDILTQVKKTTFSRRLRKPLNPCNSCMWLVRTTNDLIHSHGAFCHACLISNGFTLRYRN